MTGASLAGPLPVSRHVADPTSGVHRYPGEDPTVNGPLTFECAECCQEWPCDASELTTLLSEAAMTFHYYAIAAGDQAKHLPGLWEDCSDPPCVKRRNALGAGSAAEGAEK